MPCPKLLPLKFQEAEFGPTITTALLHLFRIVMRCQANQKGLRKMITRGHMRMKIKEILEEKHLDQKVRRAILP